MNKQVKQESNMNSADFIDPIVKSVDETLSEFELHALLDKTTPRSAGYKKLSRLYAVSAVLQNEFPSQVSTAFSSSVMSAIENDQVQMQSKPWLHYAKQVASVSVAASVAVVSLLLYQGAIDQGGDSITQESNIALENNQMQRKNISLAPSFPVDFSALDTSDNLHQPISSSRAEQEYLIVIPIDKRHKQ